jgi:hypothetical protein
MGEFENSPKDVTFTDPNGEHVAAVSAGETETISFTDVITGRSLALPCKCGSKHC